MAVVLVALGSFMLGLFCMSLLASARLADLELERVERNRREGSRALLEALRAEQRPEGELVAKAS